MRFSLTDEQQALGAVATAWLASAERTGVDGAFADRAGADRARDGWADGWAAIEKLGWLDPDLGAVELVVLAERTGAALLALPWFAAMGLAGPALRATGRALSRPATLAWAEPSPGPGTLADAARRVGCRADSDGRLHGLKQRVPDAVADAIVVAHDGQGPALFLADLTANQRAVTTMSTLDGSRPLSTLRFDGVAACPLALAAQTGPLLRAIRLRAIALLAGEAVGIASRAVRLAVEHACARIQFGRPIGAFQAVAHPLADTAAAVELARNLAHRAAWCLDADDAGAYEAVLTAAIAARDIALRACETAIQTLGGVGFTFSHPLHRLYRRSRWIASFDGATSAYRAELAALLLDGELGDGESLAA